MKTPTFTLLIILFLMIVGFDSFKTTRKKEPYVPIADSLDMYRIQHNKDRVSYEGKLTKIIINQQILLEN